MRGAPILGTSLLALAVFATLGCSSSSSDSEGGSGGTAMSGRASSGGANSGGANSGGNVSAGSGGVGGAIAGSGGAGAPAGGTAAGTGGNTAGAGGASPNCKRGIATNTPPGSAFSPKVAWWYNWASNGDAAGGIEFVPMLWGANSLDDTLPADLHYLLTFNEPNFHAQSNLTAEQAAAHWPEIEAKVSADIPLVSPGMNFCGPAEDCNGTNPYQYLKDFFAACNGCRVDYVAVHWYNCDLPSLRDYLEPGNNLEGFEQFGKPIWLTEFSCNSGASAEEQEAFMREAIPYLESNPNVYRYSWFSAGPIPDAKLMNDDGSPNALGLVYIDLAPSCP